VTISLNIVARSLELGLEDEFLSTDHDTVQWMTATVRTTRVISVPGTGAGSSSGLCVKINARLSGAGNDFFLFFYSPLFFRQV